MRKVKSKRQEKGQAHITDEGASSKVRHRPQGKTGGIGRVGWGRGKDPRQKLPITLAKKIEVTLQGGEVDRWGRRGNVLRQTHLRVNTPSSPTQKGNKRNDSPWRKDRGTEKKRTLHYHRICTEEGVGPKEIEQLTLLSGGRRGGERR